MNRNRLGSIVIGEVMCWVTTSSTTSSMTTTTMVLAGHQRRRRPEVAMAVAEASMPARAKARALQITAATRFTGSRRAASSPTRAPTTAPEKARKRAA